MDQGEGMHPSNDNDHVRRGQSKRRGLVKTAAVVAGTALLMLVEHKFEKRRQNRVAGNMSLKRDTDVYGSSIHWTSEALEFTSAPSSQFFDLPGHIPPRAVPSHIAAPQS
jgi:hypothetical protein